MHPFIEPPKSTNEQQTQMNTPLCFQESLSSARHGKQKGAGDKFHLEEVQAISR